MADTPTFVPVELPVSGHWIEWFEAMLANEVLLVRCIPLFGTQLPNNAASLVLNFDSVVAFRATADPFYFDRDEIQNSLPRSNGRALDALFLMSSTSHWIDQASAFHPQETLVHYVLASVQDQVLEVLARGPILSVQFEAKTEDFNPRPTRFRVN